jgi:hypothetical protein
MDYMYPRKNREYVSTTPQSQSQSLVIHTDGEVKSIQSSLSLKRASYVGDISSGEKGVVTDAGS